MASREVVLRIQKPVHSQQQQQQRGGGFVGVGGRMMTLVEGLNAALSLGIRTLNVLLTDNKPLHNHMVGIWRPRQKKPADTINEALSAKQKFQQCEILCVPRNQVDYVTKLATDLLKTQIAKAVAVNAGKEKRENCTIFLEDTDISKIHAVEGCAHRFCFSCMKEHVKVKLLHGMLPACPQDGCTTKLTVEGLKIFLSPRLLAIMVQRIREAQIPPTQKIYCPYPKCSALMSMSELIYPMQASSSKYTVVDVVTLRKCVKCTGSFCISCKVPWDDQMTCYDYKRRYPHARLEEAYLQNLAQQRLWRQCVRCKHMIELAEGCYHMTCVASMTLSCVLLATHVGKNGRRRKQPALVHCGMNATLSVMILKAMLSMMILKTNMMTTMTRTTIIIMLEKAFSTMWITIVSMMEGTVTMTTSINTIASVNGFFYS